MSTLLDRVLAAAAAGEDAPVQLLPKLDPEVVEALREVSGGELPAEVEELLQHCGGLVVDPEGEGRELSFAPGGDQAGEFVPRCVNLSPDGFGNEWVVELDDQTGAWGRVLFACHDPPVLVVQAASLSEYFDQLLAPEPTASTVCEEAVSRAWAPASDAAFLGLEEAQHSSDPVITELVAGLEGPWKVYDFRNVGTGGGFAWARREKDDCVRSPTAPVFRLRRTERTGWRRRLFGP